MILSALSGVGEAIQYLFRFPQKCHATKLLICVSTKKLLQRSRSRRMFFSRPVRNLGSSPLTDTKSSIILHLDSKGFRIPTGGKFSPWEFVLSICARRVVLFRADKKKEPPAELALDLCTRRVTRLGLPSCLVTTSWG